MEHTSGHQTRQGQESRKGDTSEREKMATGDGAGVERECVLGVARLIGRTHR